MTLNSAHNSGVRLIATLEITIQNRYDFLEEHLKSYSAESLSIPVTTAVRAVRATDSKARSAQLLSTPEARVSVILRDLKPRFLEGLTPPELKSLLAAAQHRRLPANCVITQQDDPAEHLFLLLTGRARYFFVTEKGQKVILLWIPPGEIFGVATLLSAPSGYLTNTETGRNSSMLVWDRAAIRGLCARHPRLYENALYLIIHAMAAYRAKHRALICATVRERFAHVLVTLATGIGHKVDRGVELDVTNEELANEANVTLFAASRLLNEWQRAGMLLKSRGKILLRSPERLLRYEENDTSPVASQPTF